MFDPSLFVPILRLTPAGELFFDPSSPEQGTEMLTPAFLKALSEGFHYSGAEGLLTLGSDLAEGTLPDSLHFWRGFVREWLQQICQLPRLREDGWQGGPQPNPAHLTAFIQSAPLLQGMEYLTESLLDQFWQRLNNLLTKRIANAGGDVAAVLHDLHPAWRLVGRVTLHLAENKRNQEFPFAFIATYSHRLGANSSVQYLPLAQALKESAASADKSLLQTLLAPLQKASARSLLIKELVDSRRIFQALSWTPTDAFHFLQGIPVFEECGLLVKVPDWWVGRHPPRPVVQVTVGGRQKGSLVGANSLLNFQVTAAIGEDAMTAEELAKLLESTSPLVSLKGRWVEVDHDKLRQALGFWKKVEVAHENGVTFHEGMRWLAGLGPGGGLVSEETAAGDEVNHNWVQVKAGEQFRNLLHGLREPGALPGVDDPVPGLLASLRPYQKTGVAWLDFLSRLGLGACLADDMGLGKTLQVIGFLLRRRANRLPEERPLPHLMVVPASLLGNWRREVEKFAPDLPVLIAHRSAMTAGGFDALNDGAHRALQGETIVLTTYTTLGKLTGLQEQNWDVVGLDEAQAIKNAGTAQSKLVKKLRAKVRIALTGTPVENHLGDLWSLFDFLNPGLLGSSTSFSTLSKKLASNPSGYAPLRTLIRPYILRRMKTDPRVAGDLPAKTEVTAYCTLTKKQGVLYQRMVANLKKELEEADDDIKRKGVVLAALMKLKQICNHPSLWSGDARFDAADSGKFERLTEIASEIAERQEKMLIFSQYREMTQPLSTHLAQVFGRPGLLLHGGTSVGKRAELVEHFQRFDGPPFFVISLKAGGTGLNLTAASHVVHFDRWWNPAVEDQATDRAFRIGQTKNVLVHKFVCQGTLEERIDQMIKDKKALADQLLGEPDGAAKLLTEMSTDELLQFVKLDANAL